jgi:formate hydrogenlyase subunit 3/multisubunit Na+/H+ antiporter MnhD subunit
MWLSALACISIAHAGYVLVALRARSEAGVAAVRFYLAAYAFMNAGAFAVVSHISSRGEKRQSIDDLAGLGRTEPPIRMPPTGAPGKVEPLTSAFGAALFLPAVGTLVLRRDCT